MGRSPWKDRPSKYLELLGRDDASLAFALSWIDLYRLLGDPLESRNWGAYLERFVHSCPKRWVHSNQINVDSWPNWLSPAACPTEMETNRSWKATEAWMNCWSPVLLAWCQHPLSHWLCRGTTRSIPSPKKCRYILVHSICLFGSYLLAHRLLFLAAPSSHLI